MITLLSPTKTQSVISSSNLEEKTEPLEIEKAKILISLLKELSTDELSKIMKISSSLAEETKKITDEWIDNKKFTTQAIYLFQGDAFQKLDALSFDSSEIDFSQNHLVIFSALYGYLRPLDSVSPYRLDMKDKLIIPDYSNLYHYWKEAVTIGVNNLLSKQKNKIILNLASSEYFDVIDTKKVNASVVNIDFKIKKDNSFKTIGIYAKRGRGLLARYIIKNKIDEPQKIIQFNSEGFRFEEKLSRQDYYVFIK